MEKSNLTPQIFKRLIDVAPADVSLWKAGRHVEKWQEGVMLYVNEVSVANSGPVLLENIGSTAGKILKGLEKTPIVKIFQQALSTGQPQEWINHFGNEKVAKHDWHQYFMVLPQNYIAVFNINIDAQVKAEKVKAEKIKHLEELNQQLVERELAMIQLKSEIRELEKNN